MVKIECYFIITKKNDPMIKEIMEQVEVPDLLLPIETPKKSEMLRPSFKPSFNFAANGLCFPSCNIWLKLNVTLEPHYNADFGVHSGLGVITE